MPFLAKPIQIDNIECIDSKEREREFLVLFVIIIYKL